MHKPSEPYILIDVAGAAIGGSGRYLAELDSYLNRAQPGDPVRIIGRNRRLTPSWLIKRELWARRARIRIALNNVSFVSGRGLNIALLRNVLHFSNELEYERHAFSPSLELRAQVPIVRGAARRAQRLVVPTEAMAERVVSTAPHVARNIRVRSHPVTRPDWAGTQGSGDVGILVPVVPSPYKHLDIHLQALLRAIDTAGISPPTITVTADQNDLPSVARHPSLDFIGRITADRLDRYWRDSAAIYYPTTLEAFGYPLAEARVSGRNVIAQATRQNREVAGEALCGYTFGDENSLASAVQCALEVRPAIDWKANDPLAYFEWLFGGADNGS